MSDDDDRSEKLKQRFGDFTSETDEAPEASKTPKTDEADSEQRASGTDEASKASKTPSTGVASEMNETAVRDLPTKLLYLEAEFIEELEVAFDAVNLMYRREYGEELEKNRHWYPLLLRLGFHAIGDVDELTLEEYEALLEEVA
jgi:hypothetical protein